MDDDRFLLKLEFITRFNVNVLLAYAIVHHLIVLACVSEEENRFKNNVTEKVINRHSSLTIICKRASLSVQFMYINASLVKNQRECTL